MTSTLPIAQAYNHFYRGCWYAGPTEQKFPDTTEQESRTDRRRPMDILRGVQPQRRLCLVRPTRVGGTPDDREVYRWARDAQPRFGRSYFIALRENVEGAGSVESGHEEGSDQQSAAVHVSPPFRAPMFRG